MGQVSLAAQRGTGGNSTSPSVRFRYVDHLFAMSASTSWPYDTVVFNAGSNVFADGEIQRPGLIRPQISLVNTILSSYILQMVPAAGVAFNSIFLSANPLTFETRIRFNRMPSAGGPYVARVGLMNTLPVVNPPVINNAILHTLSFALAPVMELATFSGGVSTFVAANPPIIGAGIWYTIRLEATLTNVDLYIDETLLASSQTNIPITGLTPTFWIQGGGAGAPVISFFDADYLLLEQSF